MSAGNPLAFVKRLLLHMGEKLPGASGFCPYVIAVVFTNVRKSRVEVCNSCKTQFNQTLLQLRHDT